jgi:hypothetical protein
MFYSTVVYSRVVVVIEVDVDDRGR